ncbi:uncharacterized protein TNCT_65562 [Trichonephila clavata]|uniref:Uncharacterized protein n=1 Tax=Trichonephila clavata TaxID=2740835 RepID=A0A8X6LB85_TRICU|nr:uncharacterized protein TNCT_65562 [Trichonephila clavata]
MGIIEDDREEKRDFTAESKPFPVPTLAALVPSYYPGATHFPQAMTSKEAECPPIQVEPVDLSVNKKSMSPRLQSLSFPSPASSPPSSSCIDLRLHSTKHLLPTAPGDDTSNSADEHSPLPMDIIHRTGSPAAYLSLHRIQQASICRLNDS